MKPSHGIISNSRIRLLAIFIAGFLAGNLFNFIFFPRKSVRDIADGWLSMREEIYERSSTLQEEQSMKLISRQYPEMREYNAIFSSKAELCEKAIYHLDLPFPYFIYKPLWTCPYIERIGEIFDGGKWLCNVPRLAQLGTKCVIYSFGSNGKVQFETEMHSRTNCEIHIFDPTVALSGLPENIYFHSWCLSGADGTCKIADKSYPSFSLETIMRKLLHTRINLLKIDVDGYEIEVVEKTDPVVLRKVDEISIEFHWQGLDGFVKVMKKLQQEGFRVFYNEPNLFYYTMPAAGIEYSLVRPEYTLM